MVFSEVVNKRGEKFQCLVVLLSRESLEDGGDPVIRVCEILEGSCTVRVDNLETFFVTDCVGGSEDWDGGERDVCGDDFGSSVTFLGNNGVLLRKDAICILFFCMRAINFSCFVGVKINLRLGKIK